MTKPKEAVVVGAGVGGLVTACYLRQAGWHVRLLDTNSEAGGKMAQLDLGLHPVTGKMQRWDTGPTLMTLSDLVNGIFDDLLIEGQARPHLLPLLCGTDLYFSGGNRIKLPASGPDFVSRLPSLFNETDTIELTKILKIGSEVFDFAKKSVLNQEPPSLLSLGIKTLASGIALKCPSLAKQNFEDFVRSRISNPDLREFFFHFASYVGMIPKCAASGLVSIAHVEMNETVVFPQGGVHQIAKTLQRAAIDLGVEWIPSQRVCEATLENGAIWHIKSKGETTDGAELKLQTQRLVVATDPHQALVSWLRCDPLMRSWYGDVDKGNLRPSESQFVILFERSEFAPLAHHTKIFPESWLESYRQTVEEKSLPADPCVYLVWPHATDPSICPSVLFVSAMAPHLGSGHNWDQDFCAKHAEQVLQKVRDRLGILLPGKVVKTISPLDLFRKTGSLMGGLYGAAPVKYNPGFFARPGITKVPGLSFVGGGVHPGAGVPMVMMGARRVAQSLIQKGAS